MHELKEGYIRLEDDYNRERITDRKFFGEVYSLIEQIKKDEVGRYTMHKDGDISYGYLSQINLKVPVSEPDDEGLFTTILPRSGNTVKLRLLTVGDELELSKNAEMYPQNMVAPKITWRLNKMIVSIDGNTDRQFIATFIEKMPIIDSKHIRRFMLDNEPGLDLKKQVLAPSGEKVDVDIAFGVEFFRPFFGV